MHNHKNCRREVIGLIGAHPGAGTTYTAILLAFSLGEELGRRTAVLECNDSGDIKRLQDFYEWDVEKDRTFTFDQITFYKKVTEEGIAEILNENFDCFILDFSSSFESAREEFLRCNRKIILGGRSEWNRQKLISFSHSIQNIQGNASWFWLIPCASRKDGLDIRRRLGTKIYTLPFEADPTIPSSTTNRIFQQMIN